MGTDQLWLLLATVLVLGMQGDFLLLEAGRVRTENSINVAQKNIGDLVVSRAAFFALGYGLMGLARRLTGRAGG